MTLGEGHDDEEQEDRPDCAAHLSLRAHRQQEHPEPDAGQHRRHEVPQDRRDRVASVCPQRDGVADEEEGKHDARRLLRGKNQGEECGRDRGQARHSGLRQAGEGSGRDEGDPREGSQRRQVHAPIISQLSGQKGCGVVTSHCSSKSRT